MMGKYQAPVILRTPAMYVGLLTLVGFALRLHELGERGYWFDEIVFAYPARLPTFEALLAHIQQWSDHTPLSFFLVWLVRGLGGEEAIVRLPFAIAGALGIPALYLLGKSLANARVGFVAALLYALSPFAVFISQDAHPYAPLMLFSSLQALFAYQAVKTGRALDWARFGLFMLLNLYNDYLALAVAAVTMLFAGVVILGRLIAVFRKRAEHEATGFANEWRKLRRQLIALIATPAAVFILYIPWLSPTLTFLQMPVRTFYSTRAGGATLDDAVTLANGLGFNVLTAILLSAGIFSAIYSLWQERSLSGLLLLMWMGVPIVGLWLLTGDRMFLLQTRYFSFLLPAALVLVGLGTDRLANIIRLAYKQFYSQRADANEVPPYAANVAFTAMVMLIFALAIPALVNSYSWTKPSPQAFREAAKLVITDSPPGSIVVSVGMWGDKPAPPFTIQGMEHYLWLYKSSIPYLDGSLIDEQTATKFEATGAMVWGVWALPWPMPAEAIQDAETLGLDVVPLENISLIRAREPEKSTTQQLDTLLAWGTNIQSGLVATRALLNRSYKASTLGDNVVPPFADALVIEDSKVTGVVQDKWKLQPGAKLAANKQAFVLTTTGSAQQTNVTLSTDKLTPDTTYVVIFGYSNDRLQGEQRVYLSTYTKEGQLIETFPYGSGFLCPKNSDSGSAFLFTMPANGTNALLWLRVTGDGQAEFTHVEIRPVR